MGSGASKQQEVKGGESFQQADETPAKTPTTTPILEKHPPKEEHPQEEESKCPMHNKDGSYSWDWTQLFGAAAAHGPKGNKPLSEEQINAAKENANVGGGGGCPVQHKSTDTASAGGGCPVKAHPEYNVYSQPIDKTNNMPKGAKTQLPNANQTMELSTDRVSSTIPKGGDTSGTWTYPSPQQFYNALSRKGKIDANSDGEVASEEDMASVVALHNNMNEKTWAKVVEWERQTDTNSYKAPSVQPKLLKFTGRPHDLSPKAAFKHYVLGHPLPYDRHDWTVLRNDGSTVRYVIDYYYDESKANTSEESALPQLHDRTATPSLLVDVRPALDSASALFARAVQMPYSIQSGKTNYEMLPLRASSELAQQVQESVEVWKSIQQLQQKENKQEVDDNAKESLMTAIDADRAKDIALSFSAALNDCSSVRKSMENCKTEEDYAKASMDLSMCMGKILCPVQHKSLLTVLNSEDDAKMDAALETLTECVALKTMERRVAKEQHPSLFQE